MHSCVRLVVRSLLVVANFDMRPCCRQILYIPAHAFDFLSLKEKNAQATDLLTGSASRHHLAS